jgi:hypothetical protein
MTFVTRYQTSQNSKSIDRLRKCFEAWRKCRRPRTCIPERLWESAVKAAKEYGLNKTAKTLRLDYYTLKQRLEISSGIQKPVPTFIELSPAATGSTAECIIECENQNGDKMRIQSRGMNAVDLNALSSAFWRGER